MTRFFKTAKPTMAVETEPGKLKKTNKKQKTKLNWHLQKVRAPVLLYVN